jgi:hypothetical protein
VSTMRSSLSSYLPSLARSRVGKRVSLMSIIVGAFIHHELPMEALGDAKLCPQSGLNTIVTSGTG